MSEMNAQRQEPDTGREESASEMLARARKAMNLSQAEVAEQLFLTATFIRYIDEGQFEKFPKPAFIKGYLRSYARVVSLSGDDVVAAYAREEGVPEQTPEIGNVTAEPVGPSNFTGPVLQTGIIGLIVAVLVVGLVWWLVSGDEEQAPVVTNSGAGMVEDTPLEADEPAMAPLAGENEAMSGVDSSLQEVETPAMEATNDAAGPEAVTEDATTDVAGADTALDENTGSSGGTTPLEATRDVQIDRVRDGDTNYITVSAGGQTELELAFTDDCWVEIEDGEGEKIYGDLNKAGDVMTVRGIAPFTILLGKATAASMIYDGKTVDLGRFTTRDLTARIRTARL
ncbi:MAG: helix-turn-helix domain-containing protein [Pseudomonadales bacterium]|nr:helix-turn-helix domain-containing protein [Pseudomonadales bacterium]